MSKVLSGNELNEALKREQLRQIELENRSKEADLIAKKAKIKKELDPYNMNEYDACPNSNLIKQLDLDTSIKNSINEKTLAESELATDRTLLDSHMSREDMKREYRAHSLDNRINDLKLNKMEDDISDMELAEEYDKTKRGYDALTPVGLSKEIEKTVNNGNHLLKEHRIRRDLKDISSDSIKTVMNKAANMGSGYSTGDNYQVSP